jgi:hypothetical protein
MFHACFTRPRPSWALRAVSSGLRRRGSGSTKTEDDRQPRGAHLRKDQRLDRAAAGVFSMQHRLLPEEGLPARLLA